MTTKRVASAEAVVESMGIRDGVKFTQIRVRDVRYPSIDKDSWSDRLYFEGANPHLLGRTVRVVVEVNDDDN